MSVFDGLGAGVIAGLGGILTNESQKRQSNRQMAFQERLSNTSHQREVKDLIAAGLNPVLSANAGAAVPSGSQASLENAAAPAVSSALQSKSINNQLRETESRIDVNKATKMAQEAAANRDATSAKQIATQNLVLEKQMPAIIERSRAEMKRSKFQADHADAYNILDLTQQGLGAGNSALDMFKIWQKSNNPGPLNKTKSGDFYNPSTGEIFVPWKK